MQRKERVTLPGQMWKNDAIFLYGANQPKPYVHAYAQDRTEVVYGPACKPETEIYIHRCEALGIPVRRRRGGGGTVVLSGGMVVVVVVGKRRGDEMATSIFSRIHEAVINVLGLDPKIVTPAGISDLAIDDRKILGSSLYLSRRPAYYYYQSSLMVCPDMSLISKLLAHPPKEPDYRKGRSHDRFCTCLSEEGINIKTEDAVKRINSRLSDFLLSDDQSFSKKVAC